MEIIEKMVEFDEFCEKCKHKDLEQFKEPCNECLENPVREGTIKPLNFEEKE